MRSFFKVWLGCVAVMTAFGCRTPPPDPPEIAARRAAVKQRLFYDVVPRDVDEIVVANPSSGLPVYTLHGTNFFEELEHLLKFEPDGKDWSHMCDGLADIEFRRRGEVFGHWNFAHGTFFYGGHVSAQTDRRLADWFARKGVKEFRGWVGRDAMEEPPARGRSVVDDALSYLIDHQNRDGSWGAGTSRIYLTTFTLAAFFGHGETSDEPRFGETVRKGLSWLVRQNPANDRDRVYAYHVLAVAHAMKPDPALKATALRLATELNPARLPEAERMLLALTKAPGELPALRGLPEPRPMMKAFLAQSGGSPAFRSYVEALDMCEEGGETWETFRARSHERILRGRQSDGSLVLDGVPSGVEATTFALLTVEVYYLYWPHYLTLPMPPGRAPAPVFLP